MRRLSLRAAALLLCALVGDAARGQGEAWHPVDLSDLAGAPTDLALAGGTGWLSLWDGAEVRLEPLSFPANAPPARPGAPVAPVWTASSQPRIAYDGTELLVVDGSYSIRRHHPAENPAWSTRSSAYTQPAIEVALAPSGGLAVARVASPILANVLVRPQAGGAWLDEIAFTETAEAVLAVSQTEALGCLSSHFNCYTRSPGGTWTPFGSPTFDIQQLAALGPGEFVGVDSGGAYAFISASSVTEGSLAGASNLVRLASAGPEVFALEGSGAVFHLADGTDPASATLVPAPAGLASGRAIAADGGGRVLLAGTDAAGAPVLYWRNRAPQLTSAPVDLTLTEGDPPQTLSVTGVDPDGETPTVTWSCDPAAGGTAADLTAPTAPTTDLSVPDSAQACPGDQTVLTCRAVLDDGELQTPAPFTVSVEGADLKPPILQITGSSPDVAYEGTQVTVSFDSADDCGLASLDAGLRADGVPVLTEPVDPATGAFSFVAPAQNVDAPAAFSVRLVATDLAGHQAEAEVPVTIDPPPKAAPLVCPEVLATGEAHVFAAEAAAGSTPITGWTVQLVDATAPGIAEEADPSAGTLTVTPGPCTFGATFDVEATPHGPGGTGAPVRCVADAQTLQPRPVRVERGAATVWVEDPEAGAARVLRLDEAGGRVDVSLMLRTCAGETAAVTWDLTGLPEALRETGTLVQAQTGGPLSHTLAARPEDFGALARAGSGRVRVSAEDDQGTASPAVEVPVRFELDPALDPALSVAVELWTPQQSVAPGDLVEIRGRVHTPLPLTVADLAVELSLRGFSPVPGSGRVAGCAGGRLELPADEGAAPGSADAPGTGGASDPGTPGTGASTRAPLHLDALSRGCDAEIVFLARRAFGPGTIEVAACAWSGGPLEDCHGRLGTAPERALGCSAAAGEGSFAWALALLALAVLRRRPHLW